MKKPKRCEVCGSTTPCAMCNGTGKALWHPRDGKEYLVPCPACLGTGVDHDYDRGHV